MRITAVAVIRESKYFRTLTAEFYEEKTLVPTTKEIIITIFTRSFYLVLINVILKQAGRRRRQISSS